MGNDGGSIPGRQELVKNKKREKKLNSKLIAQAKTSYCQLSNEKLQKPVVIDRIGNFYNKEPVLKALIEKKVPKCFSHIQSMKDIKTANITFRKDSRESKIICPISQIELNGINPFTFNWKCGCLLADATIMQLTPAAITSDSSLNTSGNCVHCTKSYNKGSIYIYIYIY